MPSFLHFSKQSSVPSGSFATQQHQLKIRVKLTEKFRWKIKSQNVLKADDCERVI